MWKNNISHVTLLLNCDQNQNRKIVQVTNSSAALYKGAYFTPAVAGVHCSINMFVLIISKQFKTSLWAKVEKKNTYPNNEACSIKTVSLGKKNRSAFSEGWFDNISGKKHSVNLTQQSRWNSKFLEVHVFSLKNMHATFFNTVSCSTARKTLSTLPQI